jgi:quercetin dioxygenase-like cupin family protein
MRHNPKALTFVLTLIAAVAIWVSSAQIAGAQQLKIERTDLLKAELPGMEGKEMQVWLADVPPSAATGPHFHPTPRFVYVLQGSVVLEVDGKAPQTFRAGQAFAEMPGERHNFRNASATEPAKALGFQYAGKDQALQTSAP